MIDFFSHEVEYIDGSTGESNLIQSNSSDNTEEVYMLDELKPKTVYTFRLKIIYVDLEVPFYWPQDNRFTFRTLGK